ncbi:MAG: substrate-binding domain-containing protein, partial [Oscillospiraceae bacterium]|nr:substrate-binding domain-containing protein [Oscillospiraceae bacterium]
KENGYSMQLSITHHKIYEEAKAIRTMLSQGVSGLIVEPSKSAMSDSRKELFDEIRERNIPLVFFNAKYPWSDFPCVAMDDRAAGKRVTDYLFEQGHKQLAGIFALDDNQGHDRFYGYMHSCAENGISAESSVLWYSTEERDELFSLSEKRIMKLIDGVTAVVCYNDKLAVDLLKFCREKGIRVPEDISIVGIDNSKLATLCDVGLTTVQHPQQLLGETAAEKLLELMNNPKADFDDVKFTPELVVRNSVRCIKDEKES